MASLTPSRARLRLTAVCAGLAGGLVLVRLAVRLSAGAVAGPAPASWLDRLTLWLEPLLGGLGVLAAIGLWAGRRWGAFVFTMWAALVASQVALVALLIAALAAFAWQPSLMAVGLLAGVLFAGYRLVRAVWRWLSQAA